MQLKIAVSAKDHIQGAENASVTLVEYGDYQCPHCGHAYPIVKELQKHFGDSLRFVFRNFPITEIHPMAQPAAESAEFAAKRGKFWEMHDAIYEHQDELSLKMLEKSASRLGLDPTALAASLEDGQFTEHVKQDFMGGVRSGVNGTPTFFINGQRHDAAPDFESLSLAIEKQLNL